MFDGSRSANSREIWIVNHYAITPDLPGGTRHYDFAVELAKMGYEVCIFASDVNLALRRHTRLESGELYREESINGVRFVWVRAATYQKNDWRRVWNMLSFALNVFRVGVRLRGSPKAVIGSSPHPFAALVAWVISKIKHSRFLLELRDLWPQVLIDMGGMAEHSVPARILRLLERFLYRVAAKIIVLASGSREYLLHRGVPSDKIVYIPNGVYLTNFQVRESSGPVLVESARNCIQEQEADQETVHAASAASEETMPPQQSAARRKFGFARFTVVYTGAHGPANALETILGAAQILRSRNDVEFVLVGDGPAKGALVREAANRGLDNVRFMDPIPKENIPSLLGAADAAVITLRAVDAFSYGISPNKLFDYMAAAKPVICAVPGEIARLVTDNGAGIAVEPENPMALAHAVEQLVNMGDAERAAMGHRGRLLVEHDFSREKLARRLARLV
ncbi:MAG TPA: glycosyltransferase family 4 protein [Firmicutes bacterium]|nr:glycosyltransferase family 4 protein [Bacillota bacterium]